MTDMRDSDAYARMRCLWPGSVAEMFWTLVGGGQRGRGGGGRERGFCQLQRRASNHFHSTARRRPRPYPMRARARARPPHRSMKLSPRSPRRSDVSPSSSPAVAWRLAAISTSLWLS